MLVTWKPRLSIHSLACVAVVGRRAINLSYLASPLPKLDLEHLTSHEMFRIFSVGSLPENDFYRYDSLHGQPDDNIRLLSLHPGRADQDLFLHPEAKHDPITGTLFITKLSAGTEYAALSYDWGPSSGNRSILVNGKLLLIHCSLWKFLRCIRHPELSMVLWTDAMCINQHDPRERGHQVRLMGTIYRNAQFVFSWLGPHSYYVKKIFFGTSESTRSLSVQDTKGFDGPGTKSSSSIRGIAMHPRDSPSSAQLLARYPYLKLARPTSRNNSTSEDLKGLNEARDAAKEHCRQTYWRRMWIVQEVLLASYVVVCVGEVQMSWEDLSTLILGFGHILNDKIPRFYEPKPAAAFIKMREQPVQAGYGSLQHLMARYSRQQECLDPRDRVYALLSLATDCEDVFPDYELSTLDLFFQLRHKVKDHGILRRGLLLTKDAIMSRAGSLKLLSDTILGGVPSPLKQEVVFEASESLNEEIMTRKRSFRSLMKTSRILNISLATGVTRDVDLKNHLEQMDGLQ